MQKKKWLVLFAISLNFLVSGCATAPNVPICVELGPSRGFCTWTIEDKDQYVDDAHKLNGRSWWEMRPTMIQVPPESWAEIKKFIINTCKQNNNCDSKVRSWDRKLISVDTKLQSKGDFK